MHLLIDRLKFSLLITIHLNYSITLLVEKLFHGFSVFSRICLIFMCATRQLKSLLKRKERGNLETPAHPCLITIKTKKFLLHMIQFLSLAESLCLSTTQMWTIQHF